MGKTSNYAIVMAQLVIDGKNYGMHAFITPLRDMLTHQPLSGKLTVRLWWWRNPAVIINAALNCTSVFTGIEIGDINTKFGYENMDNGFLRFNQYRIPRKNMLMKYAKVVENSVHVTNMNWPRGNMHFCCSLRPCSNNMHHTVLLKCHLNLILGDCWRQILQRRCSSNNISFNGADPNAHCARLFQWFSHGSNDCH